MKYYSTNWNFYLDKISSYAYCEKVFTKEECNKIIEIGKQKGLEKGTTKSNNDARLSKVSWLYPNDNLEFAYRKVTDVVLMLNKKYFKFDIFGLNEGFQFTNYKAPSGKYEKHVDRAYDFIIRKLSISIQLTDPSEYEGGELILYENNTGKEMNKEQGTLILFPSWSLHEVKPVTKGERNSLVAWVTGNQFK
tara:strand:+ start:561 stop:1136 length:576 start_codon:yes stop_codon:yes gene_type:complete